jgi:predicted MFS family arabinose efflux permease
MASSNTADVSTSTAPPLPALRVVDAYRAYVLGLIWIVLMLRFVDLQIISVLLEGIRAEFLLTDTQLGLLTGFAFAVFYGALGIPVAWLADRYNRRNIIAAAVGLWSLMTAVCGAATSFMSLFLARVGVGVGEAGGTAPTYSLICDYFPRKRRATIFAALNCSIPVGVFVGFLVGGYVGATYGWRAAFMAVGIPGVLVALLVYFTVKEPPRGLSEQAPALAKPPPFRETLGYLMRLRSYRHFVLASSIFTMGAMGSGIWIPSFFIRVHGMSAAEVGIWLACIYGGGGLIGALAGGYFADRAVERTGDQRWYAWLGAFTTISILPFSLFVYLWPNPTQALLVHIGTTLLMHAWMGPLYGTIQTLAGVQRRAMAAAINMLTINLIAYSMGPLLVGMASDFLTPQLGSESLRYSILAVVALAYTWAGLHFLLAARTLRHDLKLADSFTK